MTGKCTLTEVTLDLPFFVSQCLIKEGSPEAFDDRTISFVESIVGRACHNLAVSKVRVIFLGFSQTLLYSESPNHVFLRKDEVRSYYAYFFALNL